MSFALSTCPLAQGCATNTFYNNAPFIAEVLECTASELSPQVYDDVVGEAETVYDLVEEFNCFFQRCLGQGHILDPLGELVDHHEHAFEISKGRLKGPNHI
jgi:hypothetical protein